ncbi:MAG: MBL fold metallo-hydrolase [Alistipes sp.]
MAFTALVGCSSDSASRYPQESYTTKNGENITLTFFRHASLAITYNDKQIYIDPVTSSADYATLPHADLILVTHSHDDHLDLAAINSLRDAQTTLLCDSTSAASLGDNCEVMIPGKSIRPRDYVQIEALPAYNTTEGHLQFHPRERADCGYLLTIGGSRIYIAGDGENTPEMEALTDIDIAFLPVNQPYTMTVDQAISVVKTMRPTIFYPYHTGQTEITTDLNRLASELKAFTEVRIRPME